MTEASPVPRTFLELRPSEPPAPEPTPALARGSVVPPRIKLAWKDTPFLLCHVAALGVFFVPFRWSLVALCVGLYLLRMFAITAGYHRYFSHRSYKTSRGFQLVLGVLGSLALQKGPLWWASHHRHHHRFSDRYGDLHSPGLQGFLWAHLGWFLGGANDEVDRESVADLVRFPELVWLDRHHAVPALFLAVGLFFAGGLPALLWGFFASTVLTWHATYAVNSLTHLFGRRRYRTRDDSRNSLWIALLTLGEGWHNNHHYYKAAARQGFFWWEVDVSYYLLRLLAAIGLVWDLKQPPRAVVASSGGKIGTLLDPLRKDRLEAVLTSASDSKA